MLRTDTRIPALIPRSCAWLPLVTLQQPPSRYLPCAFIIHVCVCSFTNYVQCILPRYRYNTSHWDRIHNRVWSRPHATIVYMPCYNHPHVLYVESDATSLTCKHSVYVLCSPMRWPSQAQSLSNSSIPNNTTVVHWVFFPLLCNK